MDFLVNESIDAVWNISSLPEEMLIKIFGYLTHNELGRIARVCRKWNMLARCPVLWRKVNVEFHGHRGSQDAIVKCFVNILPSCVTCIKFNFKDHRRWREPVNFKKLCVMLQEKCPQLEMLFLYESKLSHSLPLVIDLCTQFLPRVKRLILHFSEIPGYPTRIECDGASNIEVLDVFGCYLGHVKKPPFSQMPSLKELHLGLTCVHDYCFIENFPFLNQLEVLNLSDTWTGSTAFIALQEQALQLKELFMCGIALEDVDLQLSHSAFPRLKTICLGSCHRVTCEGIVSLIQSCESLQNIYVDKDVAQSFIAHPFVIVNRHKSGIVKTVNCDHNHSVDYMHN